MASVKRLQDDSSTQQYSGTVVKISMISVSGKILLVTRQSERFQVDCSSRGPAVENERSLTVTSRGGQMTRSQCKCFNISGMPRHIMDAVWDVRPSLL